MRRTNHQKGARRSSSDGRRGEATKKAIAQMQRATA
jgi:hypothetical protein